MEKMKIENKIKELLLSTKREGMADLLRWMDKNGFFEAPCSTQHHLCEEGGLAEHSLNVCEFMLRRYYSHSEYGTIQYDFIPFVEWESVIISSLLHDLGKTGQFGKSNYVENMISDRKGGFKQSDKKPFVLNKELLTVPHEVRSVQIATQFIELTEEENWAILMHNGMYGDFRYSIQGKETPLYMLLHFADMWCSRIVEKEDKGGTRI